MVMSCIQEIYENGSTIIKIDLNGMSEEPREVYMKALEEAEQRIASKAPHSALTLTRLNGLKLNDKLIDDLKAYIKHNQQYVKKSAVLGIDGLTKIALNTFNQMLGRKMMVFGSEEEAVAWLIRG